MDNSSKPFPCNACTRSFTNHNSLESHRESRHGKLKFSCSKERRWILGEGKLPCGDLFETKAERDMHQQDFKHN
ncbi:hypothetical protein FRX31_013292 [Thalictrum thalictroides]|uniref:C2H2-type domain-containing protein n=1 Tax=Thalictrum thalictroides TaxID=46969 RepID=A0A7J6WIB8_THATH|nr:hypothetical protein FRX31_013292 [Thalictrum thalictroides]